MLFLLLLVTHVWSQGAGRGISKSTYAASNTELTYNWFMKYLPVEDSDDSCTNNKCTCGTQGRVSLKERWIENGTVGVSSGFGLHTVWAYGKDHCRSDASGALSVEEIEAIYDEQIGDLSKFSAWTDYNTGLWAKSLDSYISAFKEDGVDFKVYSFTYSSSTYYSVLVHITGSQVTLELFSATKPSGVDAEHTEETRCAFLNGKPTTSASYMSALQVTRGTANMTAIKSFYKAVFNVNPAFTQTLSDGTLITTFQLSNTATVQLKFVQRPDDSSTNEHSIKWFENYLNAVHTSYMTSYNSCWDIWGDNHYAYDSQQMDVDTIIDTFNSNGWKYHLFEMAGGSGKGSNYNGYFVEPSGWQIQLDGDIDYPPSNVESFLPNLCTTSCMN